MVKTWTRLIDTGAMTLEDVPIKLRDAVEQQLIEDGYLTPDE